MNLLGLTGLLMAVTVLAPALQRDPWIGETVVAKWTSINSYERDINRDWKFVSTTPGMFYTVKKVEKDYAEVVWNGKLIWIKKEDVVLLKDAPDFFSQLIAKEPEQPVWLGRRATCYHRLGKNELAIKDYTEAIRLAPESIYYLNNRGLVYASEKKFDLAIADYDAAINILPNNALPHANRAFALTRKKEYAKAVSAYSKALEIEGTNVYALNGLAWLLSTCPDDKVRDGKRALALAEQACELTQFRNGSYVDTLAAAYAEVKNFPRAVETQEKALKISDMPLKEMDEGAKRLKLYQSEKPFRTEE